MGAHVQSRERVLGPLVSENGVAGLKSMSASPLSSEIQAQKIRPRPSTGMHLVPLLLYTES